MSALSGLGGANNIAVTNGGAIASYNRGLPFTSANRLASFDALTAPAFFCNGLPFNATGTLAVDYVTAIAGYAGGLPFTANGRLAAAAVVAAYATNGVLFTAANRVAVG